MVAHLTPKSSYPAKYNHFSYVGQGLSKDHFRVVLFNGAKRIRTKSVFLRIFLKHLPVTL